MQKFSKYSIVPNFIDNEKQYAKVTIGPLEQGFGQTLGNSLRRTLLSALPGASVFAIEINGINHEFQAIEGVKEDVSEIILNLKNLAVKIDDSYANSEEFNNLTIEKWPVLTLSSKTKGDLFAKDIVCPEGFSVVNGNLKLLTLTSDVKFEMKIYVDYGRGFKSFLENREMINSINIIATDSNFSPIVKVGYHVEEQKITKTETADNLTLELVTNGTILPTDALALAAKILVEHFNPIMAINEAIAQHEIMQERDKETKSSNLSVNIAELELSVRSYNCLLASGIHTIHDLTTMTRSEVEKIKNLGKKSLKEIQKKLAEFGLHFKSEE